MLCALIMAGGKGERFWPLSTENKPKQFLSLLGKETMIQMTVNRLAKLIPIERVFVVTAQKYVNLVKQQLPLLPERNIILEPVGKNTAPCIALSAFIIEKHYKDATIAVLPSDHLIEDEEGFRDTINNAYKFVKENNQAIVTLGIEPNRPETGYGYIKFDRKDKTNNSNNILPVERFVEKPDLETAEEYIKDGSYLWNGGMFIWNTNTILGLTSRYLKNTYEILNEIAASDDEDFDRVLTDKYKNVDSISVDYAIMEKAPNIYVIPSTFGWDDVGNWTSLDRYREKDSHGNVKDGECSLYNSNNNIVIGNKKMLLNGVENLIIVETDEYIMISSKEKEQDIKIAKAFVN